MIKPFLEWQELPTNGLRVAAGLPEPQQRVQDGGDSPSVQAAELQSPVGNLPEFYYCILAAHLMLTVIEMSFHRRKVEPVGFFCLRRYLDLQKGEKRRFHLEMSLSIPTLLLFLFNTINQWKLILLTWSITSFFADLHRTLAMKLYSS